MTNRLPAATKPNGQCLASLIAASSRMAVSAGTSVRLGDGTERQAAEQAPVIMVAVNPRFSPSTTTPRFRPWLARRDLVARCHGLRCGLRC